MKNDDLHNLRTKSLCAAALGLVITLSGCGGGGGGGDPPPVSDFEFTAQWGLERINARRAYERIAAVHGKDTVPGAGVSVGVIDSGVDLDHPELVDANITRILLQGTPDETEDPQDISHGTTVTSVIAAQRNARDFHGVAWGAGVKVFAAPFQGLIYFDWTQAYETVLASGVDIVNASYSLGGSFVENCDEQEIAALVPELSVVAQHGTADPAIFVWGRATTMVIHALLATTRTATPIPRLSRADPAMPPRRISRAVPSPA